MYPINHCQLVAEAEARLCTEQFMEAVMARAGQIIEDVQTGGTSQAHNLQAVELVARVVAQHVVQEGARIVARGMGVDLERLMSLAASRHISAC
jgi:hypothetical protein